MTTRCDVAVVGGGPAGVAAATVLARAGREVVLVDRARFPRDKCCGDGLTTAALRRYRRLGLDPTDVASWQPVDRCVVRSPSGRTLDLPLAAGAAAVATRVDLDAAALRLAVSAGAKVLDGHGVEQVDAPGDAGTVVLHLEGTDPLEARYVVAADGAWSPLRKMVGADPGGYLGDWHAMRQYFGGVTGPAARDLWVWFEPDLLPGYLWAFPLPGGRANVGFGLLRGSKRAPGAVGALMRRLWGDLLARPHVAEALGADARPDGPVRAWPIPAALGTAPLDAAGGRVLFAGDAARACDPMTGEGIGQALDTGTWAAEAVLAAGALQPALAARRYGAAVRGMRLDHGLARALSEKALAHRRGARAAVRVAGATPWVRRSFARWLFEDYERAILATPSRWRAAGHRRGPG